jgi:hypothetical protein
MKTFKDFLIEKLIELKNIKSTEKREFLYSLSLRQISFLLQKYSVN